MLLRKHIQKLLSAYYSQPSHLVVGSGIKANADHGQRGILEPIVNFQYLLGKYHWQCIFQKRYQDQIGQWLTPVELFRPFYSNTIANFVAKEAQGAPSKSERGGQKNRKIQIIELGGGRGTNALCILEHLRKTHRSIYDCVEEYLILDSSETLLELQEDTFLNGSSKSACEINTVPDSAIDDHGKNEDSFKSRNCHEEKILFTKIDMLDLAEGRIAFPDNSKTTHRIVIAMELLDNLPHDKIHLSQAGTFLQAEIKCAGTNAAVAASEQIDRKTKYLEETYVNLEDPLLKHITTLVPSYRPPSPHSPPIWVPSVACGLIHHLLSSAFNQSINKICKVHEQTDNRNSFLSNSIRTPTSIIFADFDWLPRPSLVKGQSIFSRKSIEGLGEPLITDMNDIDHECYLTSPPLCDVLFPTDFDKLAKFCEESVLELSNQNRIEDKEIISHPSIRVLKQSEFLLEHGEEEIEATRSRFTGFTPLLEDFSNCSVLTVSNTKV